MTSEQREKFHRFAEGIVENLLFKGAARTAILIATVLGGPLAYSIITRTYDAIDRMDRAQTRIEGQIELMRQSADNDRKTINDRIDIVSNHLSDTQRDYARVSDVISGFTLRDQRIEALDRRVIVVERRVFPDPH
jgi:hypothetical protein